MCFLSTTFPNALAHPPPPILFDQSLSNIQLTLIDIDQPPPGGEGYSTNVYMGRLCPVAQPLTLLYTVFDEKGTPFVYLLLTNGIPFTHLV